jgi:hypothetical protein
METGFFAKLQAKIDRLHQLFFQKRPRQKRKANVYALAPISTDQLANWYELCN